MDDTAYLRGAHGAGGDADVDPMRQLGRWFDEAAATGMSKPKAVTLATVDADGLADARVVVLATIDDRGVGFQTNRRSPKAGHLAAHPYAAMVAHWRELQRQVRLRGPVEPLSDDESDAVFCARPRPNRITYWAMEMSEEIADERTMLSRVAETQARFDGREVPRPPHWGTYLLRPDVVEFYEQRPDELKDRIEYRRTRQGWAVRRLQP